jgi:hypothetical protein
MKSLKSIFKVPWCLAIILAILGSMVLDQGTDGLVTYGAKHAAKMIQGYWSGGQISVWSPETGKWIDIPQTR